MTNDQVRRLGNFSIEITVRSPRAVADCQEYFAPGMHVHITHIPGNRLDRIVETASLLQAAGFVPVPHLAARSMTSSSQLKDFVARLAGEAGVERVFVCQ